MSRFARPIAKVTSSLTESMRIGWATFRSVIFFLLAAAFVLGVVSPALNKVFTDHAKVGSTVSHASSNATLKEVGPMAFSRTLNEWTASVRSQLNTPVSDKLDLLSYPEVVRKLDAYEQAVTWNGTLTPQLIALYLGVLFFVLLLPIYLGFSKRTSWRYALSVFVVSLTALVVLTQPMAGMTMDQASKAVVVDKAFLGYSSFQSLQATSQQELVDRPAAQAALGADGQTLAGVRYVTKVHEGKPASKAELTLYRNSQSNPIKAMIVAAPTVVSAVVDAIIQLPLIGLAVVAKLAISLIMSLVVILRLVILLSPKPLRRTLQRHFVRLIKWALEGYALLFAAVMFANLSARASVFIAHFMNNADIGVLATVGTGLLSIVMYVIAFWLTRKGVVKLYGRMPRVKASRALAASSRQGENQDGEQQVEPTPKKFKIGLPSRA